MPEGRQDWRWGGLETPLLPGGLSTITLHPGRRSPLAGQRTGASSRRLYPRTPEPSPLPPPAQPSLHDEKFPRLGTRRGRRLAVRCWRQRQELPARAWRGEDEAIRIGDAGCRERRTERISAGQRESAPSPWRGDGERASSIVDSRAADLDTSRLLAAKPESRPEGSHRQCESQMTRWLVISCAVTFLVAVSVGAYALVMAIWPFRRPAVP